VLQDTVGVEEDVTDRLGRPHDARGGQASDSEITACPPNPLRIAAIAFMATSSS
jgi:hypothetical protein